MTIAALSPTPHLVVFGRDRAGKAHASWFDQPSAELATKAADLMGMHAVAIEGDDLRQLAGTLPKGRVFSSGRAFTPFVAGKLYTRLIELTRDVLGLKEGEPAAGTQAASSEPSHETEGRQSAAAEGTTPAATAVPVAPVEAAPGAPATPISKAAQRPGRVEDIGIGSVVLATAGPMEGWWEAEVIGLNGDILTMSWRDFKEPNVIRRRSEVALLPAALG